MCGIRTHEPQRQAVGTYNSGVKLVQTELEPTAQKVIQTDPEYKQHRYKTSDMQAAALDIDIQCINARGGPPFTREDQALAAKHAHFDAQHCHATHVGLGK
jgi:hypothetical protein